ncbi:MAG: hypothetical protein ACKV19_11345, partial [Verrucomicrobiales bacterium]
TNTGSAAGASISTYGSSVILGSGGVADSGYLSLTDAVGSQNGSLVVENFSGASAQGAMTATFDINLTATGTNAPAVPADGFSFNWAVDAPAGIIGGAAEEGAGTGLTITFDTYDNADANPDNATGEAPAIGIKYRNAFVVPEVRITRAFFQQLDWVPFGVRIENDGTVDVMFNNIVVFNNVQIPGWSGLANGRFNIAGRTGGAVETHWIDTVVINTVNYAGPLTFTQQPSNIAVIAGATATFSAQVNDPGQTTWQWQSAPSASTQFTNIPGATTDTHETAATALADNGRQYRVIATGANGPIQSNVAVLKVLDPQLPAPTAQLDFDNPSTLTYGFAGSGVEEVGQGVDGSGFASLTAATNGQMGVLAIDDFNAGQPVNSIVVAWDMRIGGGSSPPADGVSFVWGDDVGDSSAPALFGEEGSGNGLIVSFDTYENGNGDVPGISLKYQGSLLAEKPMPYASFLSDPEYFPVAVILSANGRAQVRFNNEVIFDDVVVPGWTSESGANFLWGGRTGGLNENNFIDNIRITTTLQPPVSTDTISIGVVGGNIIITYTGTLQSSPSMGTGTWQNVPGAVSPYSIPLPSTGSNYYRSAR